MTDCDNQAAEHQTDDFRSDVLHSCRAVHAQRAGYVTQKTGNTEAHVQRIAQHDQQGGKEADGQPGKDDRCFFFFQFHFILSESNQISISSIA